MEVSSSKRQRLQPDETSESVNDSHNSNEKMYHKVICQKDYLQCICHFLSIPEIISIFYRLSQFHNNFLIDKDQLQMYYLLLSYDFGNIRAIIIETTKTRMFVNFLPNFIRIGNGSRL